MSFNAVRCLPVLTLAAAFCILNSCFAGEVKRPLTPAELVQIAKSNAVDALVRQGAIGKLGDITEAEERALGVSEIFLDIVKTSLDPFVARAAVRALTRLQMNVSKRPKTKYIKDFTIIIKDKNAIPGVRSEIAQCFADTLDKDELNDREAFKALKELGQSKAEQNIALRGRCIEAMGKFGDPDAIVMLCELLSDPDAYIKEAAAIAISSLLDKAPAAGANVSVPAINKIVEMVNDDKLNVDLRVVVILADAKLMAAGTPGANKGLDTIIKLVANAQEDKIVLASIQALGIVGTPQATDPLIKTYTDFFNATNVTNEKDVPVRRAVANALRAVLTAQGVKPAPDMQTVHKIAVLLVTIIDTPTEVTGVKESAIYAIGYLYPKKFDAEHKDPAFSLITLLDNKLTDVTLKSMIPDMLEALTRVNYGPDAKRWLEWFSKTYPGARVEK